MSLMFSGSGDDSDTISSADSPVSADRQTRFSLKLLYFFSGAALLALLLSVFVQTSILYAVFSAGLFTVFLFVWLWAVFEADVVRWLKITASKASVITASVVSVVLELIGIFLAGTSLVYTLDVMLKTYGDFIDLILSHVRESFQNIANSLMVQSETLAWAAAVIFGVLSFFIVYQVMKRLIATRYSAIVKKEGLSSVLLFALASALWVFVPLLPLYLTNINNVSLLFVLLLAVVYMIGTLAVYFISLFISRSALVSFGVCVIAWIGLSLSEGIITGFLSGVPFVTVLYSLVLLGVMCLGGFGILKAAQEFELSSKKLSKILIVLVAVLLVINIVPIVAYNITSADAVADASEGMTFAVDDSLDHPNIYWIHAESMVDETVLEKYWGEDTFGFTEKLEERGFYVNHEAYLTGTLSGYTTYALSSMFLPTFYDSVKSGEISTVNHGVAQEALENNHEFINAFDAAGYDTVSVLGSSGSKYVRSPSQMMYFYGSSAIHGIQNSLEIVPLDRVCYFDIEQESGFVSYSAQPISVLFNVLHVKDKLTDYYDKEHSGVIDGNYVSYEEKSSLLPIDDWLTVRSYSNLISSLGYVIDTLESPGLLLVYPDLAHISYIHKEDGSLIPSTVDVSMYHGQYIFSEKIILYWVEMILESDPNAIIIIQGDHGPHSGNFEGYTEFFHGDSSSEYYGHVLSAVRIPEQYQTEDYPEAIQNPRNIVRYLINSYVGENYEYIPWEEA